jgi:hypothetical protein
MYRNVVIVSLLSIAACCGASTNAPVSIRMASEPYVTNRIAAALVALATNKVFVTYDTNGHWYANSGSTRTEYWVGSNIVGGRISYSPDFCAIGYPPPTFTNVFYTGGAVDLGNGYTASWIPQIDATTIEKPTELLTYVWKQGTPQMFNTVLLPASGDEFTSGFAIISPEYQIYTNSITYYLPTNAVWSATDQANWIAGAGSNWVIQAILDPWWFYKRADLVSSAEYGADWEIHLNPLITPNPHEQYAMHDEVTNAAQAVVLSYLGVSNAWITVDFTNRTISVSVVGTDSTNTVAVGGNGSIDPAATNEIWQAVRENYAALTASVATKAPKEWGRFAPDGSANPDPDYMTWLNAPATIFASGCAWETYGTYAVLTAPGTVAFSGVCSNGCFRIGPDSTNYFGYATGGSVTVGAVADSIRVFNPGQTNGYAEINYAYSGGDFPVLWFTPSLAVDFTETQSVLWTDNLDGTATVTAPAQSGGGFFKATTSATFLNVFETTMPAHFRGGVFGATNDLPIIYDSVIEITSGGTTYRIPAQRK